LARVVAVNLGPFAVPCSPNTILPSVVMATPESLDDITAGDTVIHLCIPVVDVTRLIASPDLQSHNAAASIFEHSIFPPVVVGTPLPGDHLAAGAPVVDICIPAINPPRPNAARMGPHVFA